jgi:glycosyltransferase involved in cell wall biosynthesis
LLARYQQVTKLNLRLPRGRDIRGALRILHVSSTSTVSGANRYAFDLAAGQKDLGHEPIVAMPAKPGTAFDFARRDIRSIVIRNPRAFSFLKAMYALKPDIVHCHDGTAARWLRFAPFRPPALVTLHIRYKPPTMSHFEGVHMLADWQREALSGFRGKIAKVNNWTPNIAPMTPKAIAAAREAAGAGPDDFLVVYVGRLEHVKGVDLLIDGFRALPDPKLRLAVVGVGLDEAATNARGAGDPRIRFIGYSSTPMAWYGAADLLVMPSRREPFALVALEAMACGAPIVATTVDGFSEMFRGREDCLVVPESSGALSEAIALRAARKTAPGIVRDSYDMARFERTAGVAAVTRFYDEVVAARRR